MKWLRDLFSKKTPAPEARPKSPPPAPRIVPPGEAERAERIRTQNIREWADRLEAEGRRTGNAQFLKQARNIRARHGML